MISEKSGKRKIIKRDTMLVILSVLILTLVTMNVSYSAFFSVQTQSTVQTFTAGNLDVQIESQSISNEAEFLPTSESDLPTSQNSVTKDGKYATLNLENRGNVDAEFSVTLSYDLDSIQKDITAGKLNELKNIDSNSLTEENLKDKLIDLKYLNIGIYEDSNGVENRTNGWRDFGENTFYTSVSGLTKNKEGAYPILRDVIPCKNGDTETGENKRKFKIYLWLSESTPTTQIKNLVYLKIEVKSATVEGRVESDKYDDPAVDKTAVSEG